MGGLAIEREGGALGERILILDDEPAILELLEHYLQTEGHTCVLAATGRHALDELGRGPFALVMADLGLPDMDGLEVVHRVRAEDPEIAIIVVTGLGEVTTAVEAMQAGADDYLLKPLNFEEIAVSVSKVLEKRDLVIANRRHQQDLEDRVRSATEDLARANAELSRTKDYLENLLHSTVDAILTADPAGNISFVNEGVLRMLGYEREQLVGTRVAGLLEGGGDEVRTLMLRLKDNAPLQNYETRLHHRDGHLVPVSLSVSLVRDAEGALRSWLAIGKDITEQKRLDQELKELSIRDSLTGLYNHRYFYERLESEIERARRQRHPLSLLLIDLDQFKPYNDSYGHLAGDEVLRGIRDVIMECTRGHVDLGFRYGGDEFTVILPEAEEAQAREIAERIRSTFERKDFERISMSVGVVAYQPGSSLEEFVQAADAMMYEAKRTGGNRVCVFDPEATATLVLKARVPTSQNQDKDGT